MNKMNRSATKDATNALVALATTVAMVSSAALGMDCGELAASFLSPPPSARPWVYWFWMDGNSSREGITADLEAMKRAGIGGVVHMEVDVDVPKGPVAFMSPEWQKSVRHAASEAGRLGLEMELNSGPGWAGSGGPWIRPEQSMQKIVFSETTVTGALRVDAQLPQPPITAGFYRDIAVLAFPTPADSGRIWNLDEKALYHRGHFSSEAGVPAYIEATTTASCQTQGCAVDRGSIVDLTSRTSREGRLRWDAPSGKWTILRFGHTSTGANTRPAPKPGIGLECDKLDRKALDAHCNAYLEPLVSGLSAKGREALCSVHIDSWEMGPQNWTSQFREEFRHRRRYDPVPFLPALAGFPVESPELTERFLWDMRKTVQELIVANYAGHFREIAQHSGMRFSIEPYDGTPCSDLTYGAEADVPMCEFWVNRFETWFSCFEAASIAHTHSRRVVAAEAFTADDAERWSQYPGSIKALGDWAFCAGVNRLVFHRYAHQPWLDRWPGMTMGPYGIHYDRTQTWWEMAPAFHDYLSRCQHMLQQGIAVADICYLAPEGGPYVFRPPAKATRNSPPERRGYSFDACTPETLLSRMSVKDGQLWLPGGMTYRVLVLPQVRTMTPDLLRKIGALANSGATVIGSPPSFSPSLEDYPECDAEVRRLAERIWGHERGIVRRFGKGRVIWADPALATSASECAELFPDYDFIAEALERDGVPPDFEAPEDFRYTHRREGDLSWYFVSSRRGEWVAAQCAFRVAGQSPEIWDPRKGTRAEALSYAERDGRTTVPLCLEPYGSRFVVFRPKPRNKANSDAVTDVLWNGRSALPESGQTLSGAPDCQWDTAEASLICWKPGTAEVRHAREKSRPVTIGSVPEPIDMSADWQVAFQPGRGAPAKISLSKLIDLSTHPDPGVRYFSGVTTYSKVIDWEVSSDKPGRRFYLDMGDVQVMARILLNGRDLGVEWTPPFRADVTGQLRSGKNRIEIEVANLWHNRLIGDSSLPAEKRIAWTTWNPFTPEDKLPKSGLLGPVRIVAAEAVPMRDGEKR